MALNRYTLMVVEATRYCQSINAGCRACKYDVCLLDEDMDLIVLDLVNEIDRLQAIVIEGN